MLNIIKAFKVELEKKVEIEKLINFSRLQYYMEHDDEVIIQVRWEN